MESSNVPSYQKQAEHDGDDNKDNIKKVINENTSEEGENDEDTLSPHFQLLNSNKNLNSLIKSKLKKRKNVPNSNIASSNTAIKPKKSQLIGANSETKIKNTNNISYGYLTKKLNKLKEINSLFGSSIEASKDAVLLPTSFKADARSIKESLLEKYTANDNIKNDENDDQDEDEISDVIIILRLVKNDNFSSYYDTDAKSEKKVISLVMIKGYLEKIIFVFKLIFY
jgi:hypothetical protein